MWNIKQLQETDTRPAGRHCLVTEFHCKQLTHQSSPSMVTMHLLLTIFVPEKKHWNLKFSSLFLYKCHCLLKISSDVPPVSSFVASPTPFPETAIFYLPQFHLHPSRTSINSTFMRIGYWPPITIQPPAATMAFKLTNPKTLRRVAISI